MPGSLLRLADRDESPDRARPGAGTEPVKVRHHVTIESPVALHYEAVLDLVDEARLPRAGPLEVPAHHGRQGAEVECCGVKALPAAASMLLQDELVRAGDDEVIEVDARRGRTVPEGERYPPGREEVGSE